MLLYKKLLLMTFGTSLVVVGFDWEWLAWDKAQCGFVAFVMALIKSFFFSGLYLRLKRRSTGYLNFYIMTHFEGCLILFVL